MSFADRRSALADSTGPKTLVFNRWLFTFLELALALFAMVARIGANEGYDFVRGDLEERERLRQVNEAGSDLEEFLEWL